MLLNAPYHQRSLVQGYREVGIKVLSSAESGSTFGNRVDSIFDLGVKTSESNQMISSTDIATYPCQGSTGINSALTGESPNPVPIRDLNANPLGSTIYIMTRQGNSLIISNASLTNVATSQAVTLRTTMTASNDPNGHLNNNEVFVTADAPMLLNTPYMFTYSGTNNGVTFTNRSFTFTTGSSVH